MEDSSAERTAQRTAALRNELAERPEVALTAVVHALAVATFYGSEPYLTRIEMVPVSQPIPVPRIEPGAAERAADARHVWWLARLPDPVTELWDYVASLAPADRLTLLAHCVSLRLDAAQMSRPRAFERQVAEAAAKLLANAGRLTASLRRAAPSDES